MTRGKEPVFVSYLVETKDAFIDMSLEETIKWVGEYCVHLSETASRLKSFAGIDSGEIQDLLSEETINRYNGLAIVLSFPYEKYRDFQEDSIIEQGLLVQSWSTLGSLLESTLQIFLSIYLGDFTKSTWNTWNTESIEQIRGVLGGTFDESLKEIVEQNKTNGIVGLNSKIRKSFKEKAQKILKDKEKKLNIEKLTLSQLIDFYCSEEIFPKEKLGELQKVRDYRNSIHAFQKRKIGTWNELNEYSKFFLIIITQILDRLPEFPDEVPFDSGYSEEKIRLMMKRQEWFEHKAWIHC